MIRNRTSWSRWKIAGALLWAVFFLFPGIGRSQAYLDTLWDFDCLGAAFYNVIEVNDTLVLNGACLDPNSLLWGLFIAEMDSSGNPISTTHYFDTMGGRNIGGGRFGLPLVRMGDRAYLSGGIKASQLFMLGVDSGQDSVLWSRTYFDAKLELVRHIYDVSGNLS